MDENKKRLTEGRAAKGKSGINVIRHGIRSVRKRLASITRMRFVCRKYGAVTEQSTRKRREGMRKNKHAGFRRRW